MKGKAYWYWERSDKGQGKGRGTKGWKRGKGKKGRVIHNRPVLSPGIYKP